MFTPVQDPQRGHHAAVRRDSGRPDRRGGGQPLLHSLHLPAQQDRPGGISAVGMVLMEIQ